MHKDMQSKSAQFISTYLSLIGIEEFLVKESFGGDDIGYVISVEVPKGNARKIGILKGKRGRNLMLLKQLMRVVGFVENKKPTLIIKLV